MISGFNLGNTNKADSANPGESAFVSIGKIHRAHGIHGEMVFSPTTDFPERIRSGKKVYVGKEFSEYTIQQVRQKPPFLLIRFREIQDKTAASQMLNTFVYVSKRDLPELPEGEYYFHQLIGMQVINPEGMVIGTLKEILETGANDVYVVITPEGNELLLADIPEVILKIDPAANQITARPPEWYQG